MTARQAWEGVQTELGKTGSPSLLLSDFNYWINKAFNQYVNKLYNMYDTNLQTTDNLRVLKSRATLIPLKIEDSVGATAEVTFPSDYLHLLNCICVYRVNKSFKCNKVGSYVQFAARRLTADTLPVIINDYYQRPLPERPYFYIHNVNSSEELPTNPSTDMQGIYNVLPSEDTKAGTPELVTQNLTSGTNFDRVIKINLSPTESKYISTVEREAALRYGNASKIRCEIHCGNNDKLILEKVLIDYLKVPQTIKLTLNQLNLVEDTSQILECPDYVCLEILNELIILVMGNIADPRLLTLATITLSIAPPVLQPQSRLRTT